MAEHKKINRAGCECCKDDMPSLAWGEMADREHSPVSAIDALQRLKDGNERYVSLVGRTEPINPCRRMRELLTKGQWPYATVLCCADSRVPPEIIFDAGLGDLFIVRVAGNVISSQLLGSIEYATLYSTSRLIVVMGHEFCGAVTAAVHAIEHPDVAHTAGIEDILAELKPAALKTREATGLAGEKLIDAAARENVRAVCRQIYKQSAVVRERVDLGEVQIAGAYKLLTSGQVEFF